MNYRVVVVCPNAAARDAIKRAIVRLGMTCTADVPAPADAALVAAEADPDVTIVGQRLVGEGEVLACRRIRDAAPNSRLITLTWYARESDWVTSLLAGASACMLAQVGRVDEISQVINRVVEGDNLIYAERAAPIASILDQSSPLGPRLREVAAQAFGLKTDSEISAALGMNVDEVRADISEIVRLLAPPGSLY